MGWRGDMRSLERKVMSRQHNYPHIKFKKLSKLINLSLIILVNTTIMYKAQEYSYVITIRNDSTRSPSLDHFKVNEIPRIEFRKQMPSCPQAKPCLPWRQYLWFWVEDAINDTAPDFLVASGLGRKVAESLASGWTFCLDHDGWGGLGNSGVAKPTVEELVTRALSAFTMYFVSGESPAWWESCMMGIESMMGLLVVQSLNGEASVFKEAFTFKA